MRQIPFSVPSDNKNFLVIQDIYKLCTLFKNHGFQLYLVGGAVRDLLFQFNLGDLDLATDAPWSWLEEQGYAAMGYGVYAVKWRGHFLQVAPFRTEGTYGDKRHPDSLELGTLEEDAQRRDFTINALYFDLLNGNILDLVGGFEDFKKKILRTVGNAKEKFEQDALRILRYFRFASGFSLNGETQTHNAAFQCAPLLQHISKERILWEIERVRVGHFPIFSKFLPEIWKWTWPPTRPIPPTPPSLPLPNFTVPSIQENPFPPDFHKRFPGTALFLSLPEPFALHKEIFLHWPLSRADHTLLKGLDLINKNQLKPPEFIDVALKNMASLGFESLAFLIQKLNKVSWYGAFQSFFKQNPQLTMEIWCNNIKKNLTYRPQDLIDINAQYHLPPQSGGKWWKWLILNTMLLDIHDMQNKSTTNRRPCLQWP